MHKVEKEKEYSIRNTKVKRDMVRLVGRRIPNREST